MKTWNETRDVLEGAMDCLAGGQPCALVVLTHVKGSAFRRPGAKLLIRADGSMTGNVSGGCLENDLRERAMKCIESGEQDTVHYDTGSDEDVIWGLGLGCDGELDLLLVPITPGVGWVEIILNHMSRDHAVDLAWSCEKGEVHSPVTIAIDEPGESFLERLEPPPRLIIIGAGDDAIPLASLAKTTGFRVTVTDHRPGYLTEERFPDKPLLHLRPESADGKLNVDERTFVVIKNHALEMDKKWGAYFDATDARYIGILGPKKRCGQVREQMTRGNMDRIYGPAGLDIGAEGAEQIAQSIIAEMLAVWAGREPGHLRQRDKPIHDR